MKPRRPLLDHLNLATLKLVAAIEHEGSLSRAAATLHIVPSAASRRITQLENAMGVELLHRTARGAGLTAAGLSIARYARAMMEDVDTLDAELQNLQAGVSGRIQLVASISAIVQHLPQDLALFLQQHPGIKIELAEHTSAEIVELLLQRKADVGVFVAEGDIPGLKLQPYRTERLVVILPVHHRLAKRKQVAAADLEGEAFVSFPLGSAPRERIDRVLAAAGARTRTVLESDLGASVCALVAAGLGVSVLNPLAALEERRNLELAVRAFVPAIPVRLALLLPPDAPDSRLVSAFADQVRAVIASDLEVIRPYRR